MCLLRRSCVVFAVVTLISCETPQPIAGDMNDLFFLRCTTTIVGTKEIPLFSPGTPLITNDRIYLPDYIGKQVLVYDRDGTLVDTWTGDESSGLSFEMPYNIIQYDDGNIYVNDRQAGQLDVFDPAGNLLRVIPLSGQQNEHALISKKSIFVTGLSSPTPRSDRGKLIQKYTLEGEEVKVFAKKDPDTVVFSWVGDIDEDGHIYLANILHDKIDIYSPNGRHIRTLRLSSPSFNLLHFDKEPATEEEFHQRRRLISEAEYTKIRSIRVLNGHIYLQLHRNNAPNDEPEFILDIFDTSGQLLNYGIETPGYLLPKSSPANGGENKIIFLEADNTGYGQLTLREYAIK